MKNLFSRSNKEKGKEKERDKETIRGRDRKHFVVSPEPENVPASASSAPVPELSVAEQLRKIQQHLVFLERKIDALLNQSKERKPFRRDFQKHRHPFRPPHDRPSYNSPNGNVRDDNRQQDRHHDRHARDGWRNDRWQSFNKNPNQM